MGAGVGAGSVGDFAQPAAKGSVRRTQRAQRGPGRNPRPSWDAWPIGGAGLAAILSGMLPLLPLLALLVVPASADSSHALRDIALTAMAVRGASSAKDRRKVLDGAFDSVPTDLRDAVKESPVRGREGSAARRNWFASEDWYAPQPRGGFSMPSLTLPPREPGFFGRVGDSFKTAVEPYKRLMNAAAQSSWSSVAVVQTLAG